MSKRNAAKGLLNWCKSKVSDTITSVKGKYNVGSADKIKKKGKEFKSKMADEAKKAQEAEFEKRPWKDPKKKWDQALREYVKD